MPGPSSYRVICQPVLATGPSETEIVAKDSRQAVEPALDVDLCPNRRTTAGKHRHVLQIFDPAKGEWLTLADRIAVPASDA